MRAEGGAADGADGLGGVVRKIPLLRCGEAVDLRYDFGGEKVGVRDGGVVDAADVEVVEDWNGCVSFILLTSATWYESTHSSTHCRT